MAFSGSNSNSKSSYYTHNREMIGSGNNNLQEEAPTLYPLSGSGSSFQSQPLDNSSSVFSVHGVNVGGGNTLSVVGDVVRRKRGRPRKYGSNSKVSSSPLQVLPPPSSSSTPTPTPTPPVTTTTSSTPITKRGRGRPPGSGKKHQFNTFGGWLSSSAGNGFTPHVITVSIGEDIATKIISFSQQGKRAICVLSANGSVSTATLRQPSSSSGGTITYEGRFEILRLSGSFLLTADGSSFSRTGGLSVTLASPDGRVIGGGVGGVLRAATTIQVIVGSFLCRNWKGKQKDDETTHESNLNSNPNPNSNLNSNRQMIEDSFTATIDVNQNRNSMSSSSMDRWQTSHQDIQYAHANVDLMH